MMMKRREFVSWMSLGFIVTSVVGCNQTTNQSSQTNETEPESQSKSAAAGGFQPVGTIEDLEKNGSLTDNMMGVLILRGANGDLIALDRTCPHQGCAVSPKEGGEGLACPCHGSEFTVQGKLVKGPATTDLPSYEVKTENNQVLVKVS